jgi:hypothetical protein
MLAPPTATTISTVTIVYRNVGCGPRISTCVRPPANLALDPTGATPDISAAHQ